MLMSVKYRGKMRHWPCWDTSFTEWLLGGEGGILGWWKDLNFKEDICFLFVKEEGGVLSVPVRSGTEMGVQRTESNGAETDGWAWNPAPAAVSGLHRPGFFSITYRITGQLWAHKKSNSIRAREALVGNSNSALCPSVKWILPTPWDDSDDYHGQQKERLAQAWISRDSFVLWTRDCLSSFPAPMPWFCYVIKNSLDKWEPRNYSLDNGLMV